MGAHNAPRKSSKNNDILSMGDARNGEVQQPSVRLPAGFVQLVAVPEHMGGGWICSAPVKKLVEMTPEWNPEGRTDYEDPRSGMRSLCKSMELHGLGQFPVVTRRIVVEGNRRVFAADHLGWETILVLFRPWANASTFADYTHEQRRHSPVQVAETWLKNSAAVTYGKNHKLERAVELVGLKTVKWVTQTKRMNVLSLLYWAERAWEYSRPGIDHKKFLNKAVRHMARHNEQKLVRDWISPLMRSPVVLADRLIAGKPLKCCG